MVASNYSHSQGLYSCISNYIVLDSEPNCMESKPNKTLDDIEIPRDEDWEFEYETDTQAHWYRKDVPAEEIAEDSEVYTADDYREQISDEHMAFSMTILYDQSGWTVSFVAPSIRKGMGM